MMVDTMRLRNMNKGRIRAKSVLWDYIRRGIQRKAYQKRVQQGGDDGMKDWEPLLRMSAMIKQVMDESKYLQKATEKYFEDYGEEEGSDEDESDIDLEFGLELVERDADGVNTWLKKVNDGKFKKWANKFYQEGVDGERIVDMGVSDFVKSFDMPEADAAELYDTISLEHQPEHDAMDDDISGLHLPGEMTEVEDMLDLNESYLTFQRFMEIFPKRMPREIVVKAFSLLEKEACGVISIGDLMRFVEAAQVAWKDPSG